MPIAAQCGSCAARYKIVDSAAGRRVRCRRCGKPFEVPGGVLAEQTLDLRALADLERKGQVLTATPEAEVENYKNALASLAKTQPSEGARRAKILGRSIHELATPEYRKKLGMDDEKKKPKTSFAGVFDSIGIVVAIVLLVGGVALSVASFAAPSVLGFCWLYLWIVTLVGFIWLAIIAFLDHWGHGLCVMFLPFYALYYAFTHLDDGAGWPFGLMLMARLMGYILTFATITAVMQGTAPVAASSSSSGKLDITGEEYDPNDTPPPGWPEGVPWHKSRRENAHVVKKIPYMIDIGTGVAPTLKAPTGWQEQMQKFVNEKVTGGGLIVKKGVSMTVVAGVQDSGTMEMMFEETPDGFRPSEKGTVKARVARITCNLTVTSVGSEMDKQEKDIPALTWPIRPKPGQTLQAAIYEKEFEEATEVLKAMRYPDKQAWSRFDIE